MRLYIPNGSVASGRFISPRRRRRDGKIPQLSARMIFPPGAGEGGTADRPRDYLSRGNRQGDNFYDFSVYIPGY